MHSRRSLSLTALSPGPNPPHPESAGCSGMPSSLALHLRVTNEALGLSSSSPVIPAPVIPPPAALDLSANHPRRARDKHGNGSSHDCRQALIRWPKTFSGEQQTFTAIADGYLTRKPRTTVVRGKTRSNPCRLVYPTFGPRPIDTITRGDVVRLLDKIEDDNGPMMANEVLGNVSRVFDWHATRSVHLPFPDCERDEACWRTGAFAYSDRRRTAFCLGCMRRIPPSLWSNAPIYSPYRHTAQRGSVC